MATTPEIKQWIAAFARQLAEELGDVDDSDALGWLNTIETQAAEIGDSLSVELQSHKADRPVADEESTCPECFCPCCFKALLPAALCD